MITFHDWKIKSSGLLARQFDNLSRRLEVTGDLPEGWDWAMVVRLGDAMDIIPLEPMDGGVGHTLTEDQLSLSGYYAMQLRGTQGEIVKHTNIIQAFVPKSLSGTGQWPTVPSEFLEVERRIADLNAHPPVPGEDGFWMIWNPDRDEYEGSEFPLPEGGAGDTSVEVDTTLTKEGAAADAKATGDKLRQLSDEKVVSTSIGEKCAEFAYLVNNTDKMESFIFFTDPHLAEGDNYEEQMRAYLKTLKTYYDATPTSFVLCGGDWIGNSDTQEDACFKLGFIDGQMRSNFDRYYPVIGNHDTNYQGKLNADSEIATGTLTNDTIRNLMLRENGNTYYSFKGQNTMFYVFEGGSDWRPEMNDFRWEQVDWFAKKLLEDDAAHSVIAIHIFSDNTYVAVPFANNVLVVAQAYNNKTTLTLNGVKYDFTAATGRVEFLLAGHTHDDHVLMVNGIPVVITTNMRDGNIPTFDLCLADYINRKLYLERVGTGNSRRTVYLDEDRVDIETGDGGSGDEPAKIYTASDEYPFLAMCNHHGGENINYYGVPSRALILSTKSENGATAYGAEGNTVSDVTHYALAVPSGKTGITVTAPNLNVAIDEVFSGGSVTGATSGWMPGGGSYTFTGNAAHFILKFAHPDGSVFTADYDASGISWVFS